MKSLLNFVSLHKFVENKNIFLVPLLLVDHVESLFHLHSNHRKTKNIDRVESSDFGWDEIRVKVEF